MDKERREQESGTLRPDKGKRPEGYQAGGGNHGGGNQGPPRTPPPGNDPEPSDDGSDHGHGGGKCLWLLFTRLRLA